MSDARRTDVIVVGAGVAGLSAALAARRAGAEVTVLEAAAGATALSSGAWDVASDPRASLAATLSPRRTVRERVRHVARELSYHPYARIGGEPDARVAEAHAAVLPALGGYDGFDPDGEGVLLATDLGLLRRAAVAQHELLDLVPLGGGTVAVASVPGGFDGRFVAASLTEMARLAEDARRFEPVEVAVEGLGDAVSHPHELARAADGEQVRERLATALAEAIGGGSYDAVLLPPVLGLEDAAVREAVQATVGKPVGEAAVPLAGPQGLRLARRIHRALEQAGCARQQARVARIEPSPDGSRIEREDGETMRAGAVVLATGKHVGGGLLVRDGRLLEPLADLPIWLDGRLAPLPSSPRGPDPEVWFGRELAEGGAGWRQGVGYDADMRALGHGDAPVAPDLFVAGALLDGFEPSRDGTGLGCCATTGWIAGRAAAKRAGR